MLEQGEIVEHTLHGVCVVVKTDYYYGVFQGAILRPTTEEGQRSLQQASLNKTGQFYEPNPSLIQGA
jgi:hypothetical protein